MKRSNRRKFKYIPLMLATLGITAVISTATLSNCSHQDKFVFQLISGTNNQLHYSNDPNHTNNKCRFSVNFPYGSRTKFIVHYNENEISPFAQISIDGNLMHTGDSICNHSIVEVDYDLSEVSISPKDVIFNFDCNKYSGTYWVQLLTANVKNPIPMEALDLQVVNQYSDSEFYVLNGLKPNVNLSGYDTLLIPAVVVQIKDYAFANAFNNNYPISIVEFPDNSYCTDIGKNAFSNCESIMSLILPPNLKRIEPNAFGGCQNFQNFIMNKVSGGSNYRLVNFEKNNIIIGQLVIPISGLTTDENLITSTVCGLGWGIIDIDSKLLANNSKIIGAFTFKNCWSIREITITNGINEIGEYAFSGCVLLNNVSFESNLPPKIDNYIFADCSLIQQVNLNIQTRSEKYQWMVALQHSLTNFDVVHCGNVPTPAAIVIVGENTINYALNAQPCSFDYNYECQDGSGQEMPNADVTKMVKWKCLWQDPAPPYSLIHYSQILTGNGNTMRLSLNGEGVLETGTFIFSISAEAEGLVTVNKNITLIVSAN